MLYGMNGVGVGKELDRVELWSVGFVPDDDRLCEPVWLSEYGLMGVWGRKVFKMLCMSGLCKLVYDGEEHGVFRSSRVTAVDQNVFRHFELQKSGQRYGEGRARYAAAGYPGPT